MTSSTILIERDVNANVKKRQLSGSNASNRAADMRLYRLETTRRFPTSERELSTVSREQECSNVLDIPSTIRDRGTRRTSGTSSIVSDTKGAET